MNFNESVTKTNLARSFAAECQAGARYQFMSKMALQNQMQFISDTMKTLAKNEMAHAKIFYDYILEKSEGGVRNIPIEAGFPFECPDLETSLLEEARTELAEANNIYPAFARIAKDEGFADIAKSFEMVANVETTHHKILDYLGNLYKSHKLYKRDKETEWKCSSCGFVSIAKDCFRTCPLCKLPQGYVIIDLEKELRE
ncbi:MAG: rubrerythrin family protein [Clostridia bacterium]|nr:rubrerythrin family protein [Clostridia bacterium]